MNMTERATLEKDLRAAENELANARAKASAAAERMGARVDAVTLAGDDLRDDELLGRLVAIEETTKATHDEALNKRDGLLRKLAGNPLGAVINGHDGFESGRGICAGFNAQDISEARQRILSNEAPGVIRLGPPPIVDPRHPQPVDAYSPSHGFNAAAVNIGDAAWAAIPSYDLALIFPYLRERPSVANLFTAVPLDTYEKIL